MDGSKLPPVRGAKPPSAPTSPRPSVGPSPRNGEGDSADGLGGSPSEGNLMNVSVKSKYAYSTCDLSRQDFITNNQEEWLRRKEEERLAPIKAAQEERKKKLLEKAFAHQPPENLPSFTVNPFSYNKKELKILAERDAARNGMTQEEVVDRRKLKMDEMMASLREMSNFDDNDLNDLLKLFQEMGHTGDDSLTRDDFKKSIGLLFETDEMNDFLVEKIFDVFDANKDGRLSFKEVALGMNAILGGRWEDQLKFCFGVFDLNGDGEISRREMLQLLQLSCEAKGGTFEEQVAECNAIFSMIDQDKNQKISFEELKDAVTVDPSLLSIFGFTPRRILQGHDRLDEKRILSERIQAAERAAAAAPPDDGGDNGDNGDKGRYVPPASGRAAVHQVGAFRHLKAAIGHQWHAGNRQLLAHQVKKMRRVLEDQRAFRELLDRSFDECDVDKSGTLDRNELRTVVDTLYSFMGQRPAESDFMDSFVELDVDKDGVVDKAEYEPYFRRTMEAGVKKMEQQLKKLSKSKSTAGVVSRNTVAKLNKQTSSASMYADMSW